MEKREIVIADIIKNYDNPIAELVQVACQYSSTINFAMGNHRINAKSIMGIMAFNPAAGMEVQVETEGEDEEKALDAIEAFLLCQ